MKTTNTKKNMAKETPKVEVVLSNFDVGKLADKLARIMPAIVNNMVQREYSKKL